jgi:hypothetical protein
LLTFFAAAKKVSAAPHRGNANKPQTKQANPNAEGKKNLHQQQKNPFEKPERLHHQNGTTPPSRKGIINPIPRNTLSEKHNDSLPR